MTWTAEQKATAVQTYADTANLGEAQRSVQTTDGDTPGKNTIKRWATDAGHDLDEISARADSKTAQAVATRLARLKDDKAHLACDLMADVRELRAQLFAPCTETKIVTLSGGKDSPAEWEVATADRDKPTFAEQVKILTAIGIAVDKIQVLTGEATERIDITGDVRTRAVELTDELARRRAAKVA